MSITVKLKCANWWQGSSGFQTVYFGPLCFGSHVQLRLGGDFCQSLRLWWDALPTSLRHTAWGGGGDNGLVTFNTSKYNEVLGFQLNQDVRTIFNIYKNNITLNTERLWRHHALKEMTIEQNNTFLTPARQAQTVEGCALRVEHVETLVSISTL